jgi:hypothetical protein
MVDLNKSNQFTFGPQTQQSNFFAKPQTTNSSFTFGQQGSQGSTMGVNNNPLGGTSSSNLFGNTSTQPTTGLTGFGSQPSSTNLFGSTSTQPTTGLTGFGSQPSSSNLFGSTNLQPSTNTSTGIFGNIFIYIGNKTTTPSSAPLFGSTSFNAPTGSTSLFNTGSNPLLSTNPSNFNTPLPNTQSINNPYSNVFLISSVNVMKHDKVETLPEDVKKQIVEIENEINNNDIVLDQTCKTINDLYSEFGLIKKEGQKMLNCLKLIYTKHQKISYIIEGLKSEVRVQNDFLEQNIRNYNILHNYPEMKINIPSQYFTKLAVEFGEKIENFKKELAELETIIQLTYQVSYYIN